MSQITQASALFHIQMESYEIKMSFSDLRVDVTGKTDFTSFSSASSHPTILPSLVDLLVYTWIFKSRVHILPPVHNFLDLEFSQPWL